MVAYLKILSKVSTTMDLKHDVRQTEKHAKAKIYLNIKLLSRERYGMDSMNECRMANGGIKG